MQDALVLSRWVTFNVVGFAGMLVQLAVLTLLVHVAGLHYLAATVLAVEAALLHNFLCHQRWTWRDRPAPSRRASIVRLARFQLLNGSVSFGGNLVLMSWLSGQAGLDPVIANIAAIAVCSAVNFVTAQRLVFDEGSPARSLSISLPLLLLLLLPAPLHAGADDGATLRAETLAAWHAYERAVDERYARQTAERFFAADAFAAGSGWRQAALGGGTPMLAIRSSAPGAPEPSVPDGRIHHWAGAVFIPGVTLDSVMRYLVSYAGQEAGKYEDVVASKLLARDGDRLRVFLKLRRTKVITATYNTEHSVEYRRISSSRASGRSVSTKIAELADAGTPREREKPPGDDSGYLWRLNAYWRYEQVGTGVLIECESVSLSRSVPALLRPFISGIVEGVARESLEKTLGSLRVALSAAATSARISHLPAGAPRR
ncbi:MAG TPA: GtrA family protein [Armatimonadota bacterium]|nr:GtrA family protein [Armatimonadota bacterium]